MDDDSRLGFIWILGIIIGVILVIGFFMSWEQIPAGSVGVKDTFGSIADEEYQPGLYFVGPFV
jgi:regulator of protease activity HflC (stomatin/prohibitin superfamily)